MATIHANNPREAISRLEQMIGMAGLPMTPAVDPRPDLGRHPHDRAAAAPERRQAQGHLASPRSPAWRARSSRCRRSSSTSAPAPTPDGNIHGHHVATGRAPALPAGTGRARASTSRASISTRRSRCESHAMSFDLDPLYLFYGFAALAAVLVAEALYLLFHNTQRLPQPVNRRLKISSKERDREKVLVQLRRERGLSADGGYALPMPPSTGLCRSPASRSSRARVALDAEPRRRAAFLGVFVWRGELARGGRRRARRRDRPAARGADLHAQAPADGVRGAASRKRSTSSCARCGPAIRPRSRSPWWRASCPIRSAPSSAWWRTRSPTAPISNAPCAT